MANEAVNLQNVATPVAPLMSKKGITQDPVKTFVYSDHQTQLQILGKMSSSEKIKLFKDLKQYYSTAKKSGNTKELDKYLSAAIVVGGAIIASSGSANNYRDLVVNTMQFMHVNVLYVDDVPNHEGRDASQWDAGQVLLEGNFNGCAESAKLFSELFKEALKQKRFDSVECAYTSSFLLSRATRTNLNSGDSPWGHAVVEIRQSGEVFYVNALRFDDPKIFGGNPRPVFADLEREEGIILRADGDVYYLRNDNRLEAFKLFGRGIIYEYQSNPDNPYDPQSSDGATRIAIRNYLNL